MFRHPPPDLVRSFAICYNLRAFVGFMYGSSDVARAGLSWFWCLHVCFCWSLGFSLSSPRGEAPILPTPECTAVAAVQLRMRMRILARPKLSLANFSHPISNKKLRIHRCEGIRHSECEWFCEWLVKISSWLRKFLANGSFRQDPLAIANAMAWCTQPHTPSAYFNDYPLVLPDRKQLYQGPPHPCGDAWSVWVVVVHLAWGCLQAPSLIIYHHMVPSVPKLVTGCSTLFLDNCFFLCRNIKIAS